MAEVGSAVNLHSGDNRFNCAYEYLDFVNFDINPIGMLPLKSTFAVDDACTEVIA